MWKPPEWNVSGGFFILVGWFAVSCGLSATLLVLGAAAVHEVGHLLVLRLHGARIRRLRISILGAVMEVSGTMSYMQELAAALAGPGANLLCTIVLGKLGTPMAAGANAVLCMFNLLPVLPLDGGRALHLLLCWCTDPQTADRCIRRISLAVAAAATCSAVWLVFKTGGSLWLLPAAGGLLLSALR